MTVIKKSNWIGFRNLTLCVGLLSLSACAAGGAGSNVASTLHWSDQFKAERIKADVEFLADDAMAGRDSKTTEYRVAANYVAAQFARLGLKPAGDDGSYFQQVPFVEYKLDREKSSLRFSYEGESVNLELGKEAFLPGSSVNLDFTTSGELVFAGFGIHAPQLGHDDLNGLDVTDKIAVVLSGAPKDWNSDIKATFRSPLGKAKHLIASGAKAVVMMNSSDDAQRWDVGFYDQRQDHTSLDWVVQQEGEAFDPAIAVISHKVLAPVFEAAGKPLTELFEDVKAGADIGSFPLGARVDLHRVSVITDQFESPNVLAVLEGSDPELKNEYVVTSAHLDHVGVSDHGEDGEDLIYNGAMDNATGVSVMMEVARNFKEQGIRPKRSILFAAVTAEEKGLLGAEYFAHYPTVAKDALVGNVNLDMPILLYDFADVIAFGATRSSLGPITEQAAAKAGVTLSEDPLPEQSLFVRSDHYRFVQQGIPAVFLMTGFGETADGEDGGKIFMEFLSTKYHTPQDEPSLPINYQAGAKFSYVNFLILKDIANAKDRPRWNEGDYFGVLYGAKSK